MWALGFPTAAIAWAAILYDNTVQTAVTKVRLRWFRSLRLFSLGVQGLGQGRGCGVPPACVLRRPAACLPASSDNMPVPYSRYGNKPMS